MLTIGILIGLAIAAIRAAMKCFFHVEQGHLAVVTRFGRALRKADGTLQSFAPGLHFKQPWDHVHDVAVKEQSVVLSGEEGSTAMAEDGTILRIDSILRYVPVESQLEHFLFGLKRPMEHVTGVFNCLLRNEIANFRANAGSAPVSQHPADGGSYALLRRERKLLNQRIEEFSRARIGERYGVRFNAVDLTDILPPDELADALNAVIQARSEADAAYARTEGESQQRELAAERGVEIAKARARAVETELDALGGYLAQLDEQGTLDLYVDRRRAEVTSEAKALYLRSES